MKAASRRIDRARLWSILALVTVIVAGFLLTTGGFDRPGVLGTFLRLVAALVLVMLLVLAGAPYWYGRGIKRRLWDGDGAVAASVGLVVAVGWLMFLWQDRGLLGDAFDGEEAWPLALAPYLLLGVVWRGRALLPALLALLLCGMLDEMVNGMMCLPAEERCSGPTGTAYIAALIATPTILLGAAISHAVGFGGRRVANGHRRESFGR
jgi:hypothetical protein